MVCGVDPHQSALGLGRSVTLRLLPAPHEDRGLCPWHSMDSARAYQQNLRQQAPSWPWRSQSVEYRLNSQGYRCPEFSEVTWPDTVVLLGCSHAFGVGVSEHQTVSAYLQELLARPVANLSQGGMSIRWCCDQLTVLLTQSVRPWAVAVLWTETTRWPWYGSPGPDQPQDQRAAVLAHQRDRAHSDQRSRLDRWGLEVQCRLMGRPLAEASYWQYTAELFDCDIVGLQDRARDCEHPGPRSHQHAARILASQLLSA